MCVLLLTGDHSWSIIIIKGISRLKVVAFERDASPSRVPSRRLSVRQTVFVQQLAGVNESDSVNVKHRRWHTLRWLSKKPQTSKVSRDSKMWQRAKNWVRHTSKTCCFKQTENSSQMCFISLSSHTSFLCSTKEFLFQLNTLNQKGWYHLLKCSVFPLQICQKWSKILPEYHSNTLRH